MTRGLIALCGQMTVFFFASLQTLTVPLPVQGGESPSTAVSEAPRSEEAGGPEIRGRVVDSETGNPLGGVNLTLLGTPLGGVTDPNGHFTIGRVQPGTYVLRATHVGYQATAKRNLRVPQDIGQGLELSMVPVAIQLKELTVTPGSFSFMGVGPASRQSMSREDLESVPQFGEDIFRAVNRLPGLASGDYAAHFSIRGGRHDETLILLDGLELYEPYHLKDFDEGAISILDVEAVEGIELLTGGFPVKYGNRLSGVFNIVSRKPSGDRPRFGVGISFMNARARAEGTFGGGKGSWILSARRGYLDLVFSLMNQNDLPSPMYYDVFSKVSYNIHPGQTLTFDVLHARDRYTYNAKATTGFQDTIKTHELANNSYGNSYAWATLDSRLGKGLSVRTMVSAGAITKARDGTEVYTATQSPIYALTNSRDYHVLGLKQDYELQASDAVVLQSGFDLRRMDVDDTFDNFVSQDPDDPSADTVVYYPQQTTTQFKKTGATFAAYASSRVRVLDPVTLQLGARYDRASYTKDSDLSPRANILLQVVERTSLRLAWGCYRQMQRIQDVAVLNGQDAYFPSELSKQWSAGIEHVFLSGARLRLECYDKRGSNLMPVYRNWKRAPDVFPETNEDRILVYPTRSTSRGVEAYFDHDFGSRFSIRCSYALASVQEEANRIENVNGPAPIVFDTKHPNPQDQRHAANVDCTYRPARSWSINLAYAFHSGWPATLEVEQQVTDAEGNPDFAIQPTKLYGHRLPAYHRLDVRVTKRLPTSRGDLRFFFELVNVTNHSNVFGYDVYRALDSKGRVYVQSDTEQWFTLLPSIGVSWNTGL